MHNPKHAHTSIHKHKPFATVPPVYYTVPAQPASQTCLANERAQGQRDRQTESHKDKNTQRDEEKDKERHRIGKTGVGDEVKSGKKINGTQHSTLQPPEI